jgi:hypothetical protein
MATEKQIDAATDAYLKARGWSDETIDARGSARTDGSGLDGGGRGGGCPKRGLS